MACGSSSPVDRWTHTDFAKFLAKFLRDRNLFKPERETFRPYTTPGDHAIFQKH